MLPPESSSVAAGIDALHFGVITVSMLGATSIVVIAVVFCIRYRMRRAREPHERRPLAPSTPRWAEATLIGGLFSLFIAFWVVGFWQYVSLAEPPADTYDIYVSGKQWMWKFAYPDGSHSAGTLYVPVRRTVRLILTSRDVIHSFYVPDFRVKQDAVPGRYTALWFNALRSGSHQVFCAEYCGTDHSRMRAELVVLSAEDFGRFLQQRDGGEEISPPQEPPSLASAAARGETVAATFGCLRCHSLDGSPHIGPTWAGLYAARVPLEHGDSTVADVAYLTESMMDPLAKIRRGFQPVMPSYRGYLKPADVGALLELIESLRSAPNAETNARQPVPLPLEPVPALRSLMLFHDRGVGPVDGGTR